MSRAKGGGKATGKRFVEGEEVMGKWPGTSLWYEAVVISIDYGRNIAVLKYSDGQENQVPVSHVENKLRFRPRSRSASPSRKSSPSRRRRSRSKSPSRKKTSPRRRSPARPKKVPSQKIETSEDYDEKPPVAEGTVTVKSKTKLSKTPPRTAVGQQLEARVTRSALKQLEQHGVDTKGLREDLGRGLGEPRPSSNEGKYVFGGPFGVMFLTLALPILVVESYLYCNKKKCWHLSEIFQKHNISLPTAKEFLDPQAAAVVYGWVAFQVFLSLLPFGKVFQGVLLKDKTRLKYRLNGFSALVISILAFVACIYYKLPVSDLIYNKFLALITHAIILSIWISKLLYLKALIENSGYSQFGNTGNIFYDFFMGKQLNPRLSTFDLKFFFELRPGLIGLVLIDLAMAHKLYQTSNGETNVAILLVCLFHFLYVADALWFESSILTTPDITTEGFGFMLVFGDIVWVPFIFSLQARFLAYQPYKISPWMAATLLVLNGIGFVIYRVSNLQKDLFRHDPDHPAVQHLDSMSTGIPGKRLLTSGWWGYVRHPNYLGDILMSISWSLTCGFSHVIPYFYPLYLTIFLIHRSLRDETNSSQKYGRVWEEYCKRVPYRIFPNIF